MTALVAAASVALAATLLGPARAGGRPSATIVGILLAGLLLVGLLGVPAVRAQTPALALLSGAGAGLLLLTRRRQRAAAAQAAARAVHELCDVLATELSAGLPPGVALASAAETWPPLRTVSRAFELGGSVPEALRALAVRSGAGDLRLVAAAWQLSHEAGGGLAVALRAVSATLRDRESLRRVVRSELASARATARLVAGLPLLTLVMGSGAGGAPVGFLLGTTAGRVLAASGIILALAGLVWIERIGESVAGEGP